VYYIICKLSVPGFHFWPDAPQEIGYLRNVHRHVFEIIAKIPVNHDDRDKEIIQTQNEIRHYLSTMYADENGHLQLGHRSCEMLAKEIADKFGCIEVTVQEDGYGGAGYVRK